MIASVINGVVIFVLGAIGAFLGNRVSDRFKDILMSTVFIVVLVIGIQGAIKTENPMVFLLSMFSGVLLGEAINIDKWLTKLGDTIEERFAAEAEQSFSYAFVNTSLIMSLGAMAILGAFEAGIQNQYTILFAKTSIDAVSALIFGASLGIGVAFAGFSVMLYQMFFTLIATFLAPYITPAMIVEIGATGSVVIITLSLNMLNLTKVKTGNMLPAMFMPIVIFSLGVF